MLRASHLQWRMSSSGLPSPAANTPVASTVDSPTVNEWRHQDAWKGSLDFCGQFFICSFFFKYHVKHPRQYHIGCLRYNWLFLFISYFRKKNGIFCFCKMRWEAALLCIIGERIAWNDNRNQPEHWQRVACIMVISASFVRRGIVAAAQHSLNTMKPVRDEGEMLGERGVCGSRKGTGSHRIWRGPRVWNSKIRCRRAR